MSGKVLHVDDGGLSGDDALAAAITHSDPGIAAMARLTATPALESIVEWFNAELKRPKSEPATILEALALMQVQTFGALAAQLVYPEKHHEVIDLYVELVRKRMAEHMARTLEAMQ
jgi:hypothetical protein